MWNVCCGVMWCDMAVCCGVWCDVVSDMVRYGVVSMVWCGVAQCGAVCDVVSDMVR